MALTSGRDESIEDSIHIGCRWWESAWYFLSNNLGDRLNHVDVHEVTDGDCWAPRAGHNHMSNINISDVRPWYSFYRI